MVVLIVGTNSWVTLAEANTYFEARFGAAVWTGLSDLEKKQLLITAYNWIQGSSDYSISPTSTAAKVKHAQLEAAWYLYNYAADDAKRRALYAQGVRQFTISKFSETLAAPSFPEQVQTLLFDFVTGSSFPLLNRDMET